MGRRSQVLGAALERSALAELARMGAVGLQEIETPSILVRVGGFTVKKYTEKVKGDIIGLWPGKPARGILCECKGRQVDGMWRRPTASLFQDHQRDALLAWHAAGGSALVAYWYTKPGSFSVQTMIEEAINFFPKTPS